MATSSACKNLRTNVAYLKIQLFVQKHRLAEQVIERVHGTLQQQISWRANFLQARNRTAPGISPARILAALSRRVDTYNEHKIGQYKASPNELEQGLRWFGDIEGVLAHSDSPVGNYIARLKKALGALARDRR